MNSYPPELEEALAAIAKAHVVPRKQMLESLKSAILAAGTIEEMSPLIEQWNLMREGGE
jgi:hypothetical protein